MNKNDNVWVKTKKGIKSGRVLLIPYSKKKDSEYLKIKWTYSWKEELILLNNVSLNYPKQIVSVPTQQYFNGSYTEETVHDLTTKTRQIKNNMTCTDKEVVVGSFN